MTKSQTNICKGVAVLLLLWHHLFYTHPEYGIIVHGTALWAKTCVHIFLLLSGYGLYFSMQKLESTYMGKTGEIVLLWKFYRKRILALMPQYWVICLLGIAVSIFVFHIMPSDVFPNATHPWRRVVMQILGLHMVKFNGYGYNPTWWFMTTIILLYLFYPLFHVMFSMFPMLSLVLLTGLTSCGGFKIPAVGEWVIPFLYGVFLAQLLGHCKSGDFFAGKVLKKAFIYIERERGKKWFQCTFIVNDIINLT